MKLTEAKLRQMVREEIEKLVEATANPGDEVRVLYSNQGLEGKEGVLKSVNDDGVAVVTINGKEHHVQLDQLDVLGEDISEPSSRLSNLALEALMREGKKFGRMDIGYGTMGNGLTFWDRNREKSGDYKKVAHVGASGNLRFYDNKLSDEAKNWIKQAAEDAKEVRGTVKVVG